MKTEIINRFTRLLWIIVILASSCSGGTKNPQTNRVNSNNTLNLSLKTADVYVTAKNSDLRLTKTAPVSFIDLAQPDEAFPTIMLDASKTFQTIVGIGGALTDASAETFYKLPKDKQEEILTAYYDPEKGIGYSLARTNINSCDFSSGSYAYDETPGDTSLTNFSIDHDKKYKIPLIKEVLKETNNNLKLFASPWSPPAWMKTNNNMLHGGKLKPEYAQAWADYYVKFMQEYQKEGIPVWGLTVQNEPMAVQTWESCIYTAQDENNFVKNYLGPTLEKSLFNNVKLMVWDHNRGIMYQRAMEVLEDPVTSKYVWGVGFHWYVGNHFENVRLVKEAFPDKHVLFTEGCNYPFNIDSLDKWHWGENYGNSIIHDLQNGASGWTDWNILLDEQGGPNHVGNFCMAPVIGDTRTGELHYMNSFYYLGHFSKFIRPGAKRIICSSNDDDLLGTAFLNPNGTISVVVLNLTGKDKDFKVWINNKAAETKSPAHSIITMVLN